MTKHLMILQTTAIADRITNPTKENLKAQTSALKVLIKVGVSFSLTIDSDTKK